jgi:hypothetical protein
MQKTTGVIVVLFLAGSASAQTNSRSAGGAKALDQSMLAGTSYGVSSCMEFMELSDGTAAGKYGKVRVDQAMAAELGCSRDTWRVSDYRRATTGRT